MWACLWRESRRGRSPETESFKRRNVLRSSGPAFEQRWVTGRVRWCSSRQLAECWRRIHRLLAMYGGGANHCSWGLKDRTGKSWCERRKERSLIVSDDRCLRYSRTSHSRWRNLILRCSTITFRIGRESTLEIKNAHSLITAQKSYKGGEMNKKSPLRSRHIGICRWRSKLRLLGVVQLRHFAYRGHYVIHHDPPLCNQWFVIVFTSVKLKILVLELLLKWIVDLIYLWVSLLLRCFQAY